MLVLEVIQIICNMVNMLDNVYFMFEYFLVKDFFCVIFNLLELECVVELKYFVFEIVELIFFYFVFRLDDFLYQLLFVKFELDDWGVILIVLKVFNKIVLNYLIEMNRFGNVFFLVFQCIMDWFFFNDEDLLDIIIDFFYQYIVVVENFDMMFKYIKIEYFVMYFV